MLQGLSYQFLSDPDKSPTWSYANPLPQMLILSLNLKIELTFPCSQHLLYWLGSPKLCTVSQSGKVGTKIYQARLHKGHKVFGSAGKQKIIQVN